MKPVFQTRVGNEQGNCLMACVASILEVELHDLVDLDEAEGRGEDWSFALQESVREHGWECTWIYHTRARTNEVAPFGYAISGGPSPRGQGDPECPGHAVVCLDGKIVHDPHKDGGGLAGPVDTWYILIPPKGTE